MPSLFCSISNKATLQGKMALKEGDRISVVGPLEQLGGLQLAELVGLQQK
jgi:hypothetical protein